MAIQAANGLPDETRLEEMARAEGHCRVAEVGMGEIVSIDCETFYELISREIAQILGLQRGGRQVFRWNSRTPGPAANRAAFSCRKMQPWSS